MRRFYLRRWSFWLLCLFTFVLGVSPLGAAVATEATAPKQDGVHLPNSTTEDDYRAVERLVLAELAEDFLSDARGYDVDYKNLKGYKAGAAFIRWPTDGSHPSVRFWGTAGEYSTQEEANAAALRQCRKAATKDDDSRSSSLELSTECTLLFEGDKIVLTPPKERIATILQRYANNLSTIRTLCTPWLMGSRGIVVDTYSIETHTDIPCDGYSADVLQGMRFVINDIGRVDKTLSPDIFPPPPAVTEAEIALRAVTDLESGTPERSWIVFFPPVGSEYTRTPYELPPGWSYAFSLHRVPPDGQSQVRAALAKLERSKMYGRFQETKTEDIDLPYFNEADYIAAYVRAFDLRNAEMRSAFIGDDEFPDEGLSGLRGEKSIRLWAECYVPVDDAWIPLRHPLRRVTPIALETSSGIYLYAKHVVANDSAGGTIGHFGGRIFDLSQCADLLVCQEEVSRSFAQVVKEVFAGAPIAAMHVAVMNPNELRFQRLNDESKVLVGLAGPYYEISTYSLTFWYGPRDSFAGAPEHYFARQKKGNSYDKPPDQLYMQVSHALQIGVGKKGEYPEPKPDQYSAYTKAVNAAVKLAVTRTAAKFGAKVVDGVGVIVPEHDPSARKQ
jgi:hypothetical protein